MFLSTLMGNPTFANQFSNVQLAAWYQHGRDILAHCRILKMTQQFCDIWATIWKKEIKSVTRIYQTNTCYQKTLYHFSPLTFSDIKFRPRYVK